MAIDEYHDLFNIDTIGGKQWL